MGSKATACLLCTVFLALLEFSFFISWHQLLHILADFSPRSGITSHVLPCPDNSVWLPGRPADAVESDKAGLKAQLCHLRVLRPVAVTHLQFLLLSRFSAQKSPPGSSLTPTERGPTPSPSDLALLCFSPSVI